jgi:poly-D-alanine transfer protein DltD
MRHIKSERLKKLESELSDLEQWLKLGLVPKKDVDKHKEEIVNVQARIEEEKERLQFLKESGEAEEYVTPKRTPGRAGYNDMPTIPDIDMSEAAGTISDTGFDMENETTERDSSLAIDREESDDDAASSSDDEDEDDDSYFSDKNRWRRGGIIDPDANEW